MAEKEYLLLKWGSLKGWNVTSDASRDALRKWIEGGVSYSAAMHSDTAEQKQALFDLIDVIDGEIKNDWSGETLSKGDAKKYISEYGG